jgi:hypothetical protein
VRYAVPDLHFERTAMLEPLELSVVRFALARRPRPESEPADPAMGVTDEDRQNVERALAKLGQKLGLAPVDIRAALDETPVDAPLRSSTVPPPNPGDS